MISAFRISLNYVRIACVALVEILCIVFNCTRLTISTFAVSTDGTGELYYNGIA